MKCIRILTGLYATIIIAAVTLLACSKGDVQYLFDVTSPDYSSEISADSIDSLFKKGVVVKRYKNHNYYIHSAREHIDSINGYEVLDFGPITFEDRFDRSNYKFKRVEDNGVSLCLLELPLMSKFEGNLKQVELEPAWLKFSMSDGLFNVNILPSLTFKFDQGLKKGDRFLVEIPWFMTNVDLNVPVLVSIRINCYITDGDYFTEVINLNLRNDNK